MPPASHFTLLLLTAVTPLFRQTLHWLVFVALAWLPAPPSASASCGDYVVWGKHADVLGEHASIPVTAGIRPLADAPTQPLPCDGPQCGKAPIPLPSTSTVLIVEVENDRPLIATERPLSIVGQTGSELFGHSLLRMLEVAKEIEHPPQLGKASRSGSAV